VILSSKKYGLKTIAVLRSIRGVGALLLATTLFYASFYKEESLEINTSLISENRFFEQNESILTNKSLGLDFCRNKNVNKCVELNANILEKQFIKGFDPNKKEYFFNKLLKSNSIIKK
jgi:hypothetical protein